MITAALGWKDGENGSVGQTGTLVAAFLQFALMEGEVTELKQGVQSMLM